MESHGGYFLQTDVLDGEPLVRLAHRALALDGEAPDDVSLIVGVLPEHHLVRLAYDAPFSYGRTGARWYATHHALARLVSRELGRVVHAYVHDDGELEQVTAYGNGTRVGGEALDVRAWEPPDDVDPDDDEDFARQQQQWPLGHLARVYGVQRESLLRMAKYAPSALLRVDAPRAEEFEALEALWPAAVRRALGA